MNLFPRLVFEAQAPYEGRVHVLPTKVAHPIAAGKVLECPAPASKAFSTTALDAGATRVEVEIRVEGWP
jgi:DNA mismatch repair protein MutL